VVGKVEAAVDPDTALRDGHVLLWVDGPVARGGDVVVGWHGGAGRHRRGIGEAGRDLYRSAGPDESAEISTFGQSINPIEMSRGRSGQNAQACRMSGSGSRLLGHGHGPSAARDGGRRRCSAALSQHRFPKEEIMKAAMLPAATL
jgi:hypothetical protein